MTEKPEEAASEEASDQGEKEECGEELSSSSDDSEGVDGEEEIDEEEEKPPPEYLTTDEIRLTKKLFVAKANHTAALLKNKILFIDIVMEIVSVIDVIDQDEEISGVRRRQFLFLVLPLYVEILLHRRINDVKSMEISNEFFQRCIKIYVKKWKEYDDLIKSLEEENHKEREQEELEKKQAKSGEEKSDAKKNEEREERKKRKKIKEGRKIKLAVRKRYLDQVISTLSALFDSNVPFYTNLLCNKKNFMLQKNIIQQIDSHQKGKWNENYKDYVFAVPIKGVSYFHIMNLNTFGKIGGIKLLVDQITTCKIKFLLSFLRLFEKVVVGLHRRLNLELIKRIVDRVTERIRDCPAEEVNENKRHVFIHIIRQLDSLLRECDRKGQYPRRKHIELLQLAMNLAFFRSNSVEKKIMGLNGINEVIKELRVSERRSLGFFTSSTIWVTKSYLCEWVLKNRILQTIFEDLQEGVMEKSSMLFKYMAEQGALPRSLIDVLWNQTLKKHEALQQLILSVFTRNVIPYLETGQINGFFQSILSTPIQFLKPHVVVFIADFSEYGNKHNAKSTYGMEILKKLFCDENFITEDIQQQACKSLSTLCVHNGFFFKRRLIVKWLVDKIESKSSAPQAIDILQELFKKRGKVGSVDHIVKILFAYVQFLFEVEDYEIEVRKKEEEFGKEIMLTYLKDYDEQKDKFTLRDLLKKPYVPYSGYLGRNKRQELVQHGLDFMTFLLKKYQFQIPFHYTNSLWQCTLRKSIHPNEKRVVLKWFSASKNNFSNIHQFYEEVLLKLGPQDMEKKTFLMFINFFIKINLVRKSLFHVKRLNRNVVIKFDLHGLNRLWEYSVYATNANVLKLSKNYLNDFHTDVSEKLNLREIRKGHIDKCMVLLKRHEGEQKMIINILKILQDFILLHVGDTSVHGGGGNGIPMDIHVRVFSHVKRLPIPDFKLSVFSKMDFDELLEIVAKKLIYPKQLLKLFHNGKELTASTCPGDYEFLNEKFIIVKRLSMKEMTYELISFNLYSIGLGKLSEVFDQRVHENAIRYSTLIVLGPKLQKKKKRKKRKKKRRRKKKKRKKKLIKKQQQVKEGEGETSTATSTTEDTETEEEEESSDDDDEEDTSTESDTDDDDDDDDDDDSEEEQEEEEEEQEEGGPRLVRRRGVKVIKDSPMEILSHNFLDLFALLDSSNDEIAKHVFSLLLFLPTNETLLKRIQELKSLSELFDGKSKYKLLYSLQIICKEFLNDKEWKKKFVELGGIEKCFQLLLNEKEDFTKNRNNLECFGYLLRLLNYFFLRQREKMGELGDEIKKTIKDIYDIILSREYEKEDYDVLREFRKRAYLNKPAAPQQQQKGSSSSSGKAGRGKAQGGAKKKKEVEGREIQQMCLVVGEILVFFRNSIQLDEGSYYPLIFDEHFKIYLKRFLGDDQIGFEMIRGLKKFTQLGEEIKENLVDLLFEELGDEKGKKSTEFFDFLRSVLSAAERVRNLEKKSIMITEMVIDRPVFEKSLDGRVDADLRGLVMILTTLLEKGDSEFKAKYGSLLMSEFFRYLFPTIENYGLRTSGNIFPKCKSRATREAMFDLFVEMIHNCNPNASNLLEEFHTFFDKHFKAKVEPLQQQQQQQQKGKKGMMMGSSSHFYQQMYYKPSPKKIDIPYTGLRNLGMTCYMNSLLQQLFMTVPFRKGLMKVRLTAIENDNQKFLYELQRAFVQLRYSFQKDYVNRRFCAVCKDIDGRPINVHEQQDVDEFLFQLMDKTEEALKTSSDVGLLKRCFKGVFANQITHEGNVVSERYDDFYKVIVEVKNKDTLVDSLKLLTEGEHLTGNNKYRLENGELVDAVRQVFIKRLPPVLIFHLKRFEYNYEHGVYRKYHGRLDYPHKIDLKPFCIKDEEYDDGYYKYRLGGVIVHQGSSANSGHYYSFIMDRSNEKCQWYRFDDSHVGKYKASRLVEDTFGGYRESNIEGESAAAKKKNPKTHSAYILFYQRECDLHSNEVILEEEQKKWKVRKVKLEKKKKKKKGGQDGPPKEEEEEEGMGREAPEGDPKSKKAEEETEGESDDEEVAVVEENVEDDEEEDEHIKTPLFAVKIEKKIRWKDDEEQEEGEVESEEEMGEIEEDPEQTPSKKEKEKDEDEKDEEKEKTDEKDVKSSPKQQQQQQQQKEEEQKKDGEEEEEEIEGEGESDNEEEEQEQKKSQKKKKKEMEIYWKSLNNPEDFETYLGHLKRKFELYRLRDPLIESPCPKEFFNEVWQNNYTFFSKLNIHDNAFSQFLWRILQVAPMELCLDLLLTFILDVLTQPGAVGVRMSSGAGSSELDKWMGYLTERFQEDIKYCTVFLTELMKKDWLYNVLLQTRVDLVKRSFSRMILKCFETLSPINEGAEEINEVLTAFLGKMIKLIHSAVYCRQQATTLINLVYQLSRVGWKEKHFLVNEHVILALCNLITFPGDFVSKKKKKGTGGKGETKTNPYAPKPIHGSSSNSGGGGGSDITLTTLFPRKMVAACIRTISYISRCCKPSADELSHKAIVNENYDLPSLPEEDAKKLHEGSFFVELIRSGMARVSVSNMMIHWCWDNLEISRSIGDQIINRMPTKENEKKFSRFSKFYLEFDPDERVYEMFDELMNLNDKEGEKRVQILGELFLDHTLKNWDNKDTTLEKVKFIARIGCNNTDVRNYLVENSEKLERICKKWKWKLKLPKKKLKKDEKQRIKEKLDEEAKRDLEMRLTTLFSRDALFGTELKFKDNTLLKVYKWMVQIERIPRKKKKKKTVTKKGKKKGKKGKDTKKNRDDIDDI